MKRVGIVLLLLVAVAFVATRSAVAAPKGRAGDAKAASAGKPKGDAAKRKPDGGKDVVLDDGRKVKAYSFGTVDLEGRLKTPQLLYFLNRVKVELDSTNDARRSFVKELKATADEKGL